MIEFLRFRPGGGPRLECWLLALTYLTALPSFATNEIDPARVQEIAGWLAPRPAGYGPPAADRAAWDKLATLPAFAAVVTEAERLAKQEVPALSDELYLDFSRTGNRDRCQRVLGRRDGRLATLTLAECLQHRGRFVQPITDTLQSIAKERTWVLPAHDRGLRNFRGEDREMDLRATLVAWDFATVDYLLADELSPATRKLIRENVESRVLTPFREMIEGRRREISWIRATHNWNAVCLAGVVGAALALEEPPRDRAWYVAAGERYVRYFLSGFTADGYCSEGIGYWNYGFGRFLMLSEAVRQATGGKLDLLAQPAALQPALYSTRSEIIGGLYPTIADCHPGSRPSPLLVRFICERFGLPVPAGCDVDFLQPSAGRDLAPGLMFYSLPRPLPVVPHAALARETPARTWFKDGGVLICRPGAAAEPAFAAVLKGGHNAEHHNHNDVGSFSVVSGKAMVVCDPGAEVYTARTFSARRYESKVLNSFGHAVPVVAGQLQQPGASARAVVLQADFQPDKDTLVLDLKSAYAVPELRELRRTFVFSRGAEPSLTVTDAAGFASAQSFETALVTWGNWKQVSANELLLTDDGGAVRVQIDTGGAAFKIKADKLDEDVPTRGKPLRLGLALDEPVKSAVVRLKLSPAPAAGAGS